MDKQTRGSSSFTENLFGPKDVSSTSSSSLFSSVFGPSSTGLGRHPPHSKKHEFGGPYGNSKPSIPGPDYRIQRSMGVRDQENLVYQNETTEPSYLSSAIYYGGQEVYPSNTHTTRPQHTLKKDGGDIDPNGSSASRGNWWQDNNFMGLLVLLNCCLFNKFSI